MATNETGKIEGRNLEAASGNTTERVLLSGDKLTIETIGAFFLDVQQAIAEVDIVAIRFGESVEFDITALQVFCSACRTAATKGKKFTYHGELPLALIELATLAGAERREICKNNNPTCFRMFGGR